MFANNEILFMKSLNINADFNNPSDNDLVEIEDKVSTALLKLGFEKNYNITKIGVLCETILDKLSLYD
jgi:hypothetical protein